jgi:hypothetical protein
MPGLFQRISTMVGSDMEKAADLAQNTYQGALHEHGHHGRAFIETLAKLCRDHPNLVGIGVGLLVEQLLSEEKREHDRREALAPVVADIAVDPETGAPAPSRIPVLADGQGPVLIGAAAPMREHASPIHTPHLRLHKIRPAHLAFEVFGGLLLLKFGLAIRRLFGRKHAKPTGWFASAARIHLLSASIATFYFASALRSEKVSAWRNAAIGLFGTDAIKPLLKAQKSAGTVA